MKIEDFLRITRNPRRIFTKDDHPEALSNIFHLFDDISDHFEPAKDDDLELVLIQSMGRSQTQMIELGKRYIVLETQQVSGFSQFMELFAFHHIDQDSEVSLFHQLWIEAYKCAELKGDVKGVPMVMRFRQELHIDEDDQRKLEESALTGPLVGWNGFYEHFEIIVAFVLAHELFHFYSDEAKRKGTFEDVLESIGKMPHSQTGSPYINQWLPIGNELTAQQREELFADFMAIQLIWKVCVDRHLINPALFGYTVSLMFNCLYHFALQERCCDVPFYKNLRVRHSAALSHCLYLAEDEDHILPEKLERFISYVDMYSLNLVLLFSKSTLEIDIEDYIKIRDEALLIEIDDRYVPQGESDQISIEYFMRKIGEEAEAVHGPNPLLKPENILMRLLANEGR